MAELGTTMLFDSSPNTTPAQGTFGMPSGTSSLGYNPEVMLTVLSIEGELGNTVSTWADTTDFLVEGLKRYYKLRGYYVAGATFETWVTRFPTDPAPSGHSLQNITVVDTWTE